MDTRDEQIVSQLDRLINKVLFLKKKSLFQFQNVRFYPAEVHLMLVVKEKVATNATFIAAQIGITKGAVSQTLNRLVKKGVLSKSRDPYNKNELNLDFTPFGREVIRHYKNLASGVFQKHEEYLKTFTDEEKRTIHRFLTEAEKVLDEIE